MTNETSLTQQLVHRIFDQPISSADIDRAALHVLDWLGCASAGLHSHVGQKYLQACHLTFNRVNKFSSEHCTALFHGKGYWQDVLAVNAAVGNVLEMDDVHRSSILHPGPVVIPAALAAAQMTQCSMFDFLSAVIRGYEVTIRIGCAIGRSHYQYFHNTSSIATFGAAAATGAILDLSDYQLVWALGNAGSRTGGVWQMRNESVDTKQFHNSEAAKSGVNAALLAKANISGPAYILEGPQGIFQALSHDATPALVVTPFKQWAMYQCSFKPWPACRHAHPAIDVMNMIMSKHDINVIDIAHIEIATYQDALTFCDRPSPTTSAEAKFSIQHAIAALLLLGQPTLEHYEQSVLQQEKLMVWREKIRLSLSSEIEACYPQHFGAKVIVTLDSGVVYSLQIQDTLGDPERPLSNEAISQKAEQLLTLSGVEALKVSQLCSRQWQHADNISTLTRLIE